MAKKVARKGKKKLSKKYASFSGRMVMIGFGSIGQGVMPLIFRHIDIKPEQITVISAEDRGGLKELVGSSRVDLQACKLEYSIVSPK